MSSEKYSIVVSGEMLVFTRDQIQSEPGNYFDTFFFGLGSVEGARGVHEITIEKDVHLFKLIQAHLRGYVVLPLADTAVPPCMTREIALVNLLSEAQNYGLKRLEKAIKKFQSDIGAQGSHARRQGSTQGSQSRDSRHDGDYANNQSLALVLGSPDGSQISNRLAPMNLPKGSSAKKYILAERTDGGVWVENETTYEGYQLILAKFASERPEITVSNGLDCYGYTQIVCWKWEKGVRALLVSNDRS